MDPVLRNPKTTCNIPAMKTAVKNISNEPKETIADNTIAVNPAAGPETLTWESEILPTTMPPTMPAIIPENNGAPDAIAIPKHKGSAIRNTTKPDELSDLMSLINEDEFIINK